jgi:membrane protease YdiL (CAAX protease family)
LSKKPQTFYLYSPAPIHEGHFIRSYGSSSSKPSFEELSKPYSKLWLFICGVSAIFLVLCVLAARFFISASNLVTFGLVYITMLLLGFLFWNREIDHEGITGQKFWTPFILSLVVFFGVSYVGAAITKNFSLMTWSLMPTQNLFPDSVAITQNVLMPLVPNTLHLSALQLTEAQAQNGLALFFNVPGPFAEEMGFRVFLWKVTAPLIGTKKGILLQGGGFGVLHFFAYGANVPNIIIAVIVGTLIGAIYAKYQNELAVGLSHFGFNVQSIVIALLMGAQLPI